jgi:hypothetical protein
MSLRRGRLGVPVALASALLFPTVPAAADDDDDHRRGRGRHHHRRHHDHDGHRGHRDHHRHGHGPRVVVKNHYHGHGHRHGHGHGYYPVHHYDAPVPYYCGPCSDYFDSYDALSDHVHHHHHVAAIELPFVIFEARIGGGMGFVFGH